MAGLVGRGPDERVGGGVEDHEAVLRLAWRHDRVVPQPQLEREVRPRSQAVLHEEAEPVCPDVGRTVAQGHGEVVALACLEGREAAELKRAGVGREAVGHDVVELATELDGLAPAEVARRVGPPETRVGAPLREIRGPAEIQAQPDDGDLRDANRRRHAVVDAVVGRVQLGVWLERDVDPVETESRFVHEVRSKDVCLVESHDLAVRLPRVAESRDGVELKRRLATAVALERVVPVQRIAIADRVVQVAGPLIDVHRRRGRSEVASFAACARGVGRRDECQQLPRDRIGDGRALIVAQDTAVDVDPLALPRSLVGAEKESAVPDERSAQIAAELIAAEQRLGRGRLVEGVPRVEPRVSEKLEQLAVEVVGPRTRRDVDDGTGVAAVFGAEGRVVDLEFRHRVDRRLERDLVLRRVVQVDAVDHEVHGVFAVPRRIERE